MAIEVKHGANPSSLIYSRFGGTEGRAWRSALQNFLRESSRRENLRLDRNFRRDQLAMTLDNRLMLEDRENQYLLARQRIADSTRRRDRALDLRDRASLIDYRLTTEQRADESKLRQALYLIDNDETLSPEDKSEARRRIVQRMAGIEPLPMRRDPSQYTEGQGIGDYWFDPQVGGYLTRDDSGNIKEISGSGLSTGEAWKIALGATQAEGGVVDVEKARDLVGQLTGQDAGAAPPPGGEKRTGRRQLAPPPEEGPPPQTEKQLQIQTAITDLDDQIATLESGDPKAVRERAAYGVTGKAVDPGDITDIATAEAHLESAQAEYDAFQEEFSKMKDLPDRLKRLARSPISSERPSVALQPQIRKDKKEREGQKLKEEVEAYQRRLNELIKERKRLAFLKNLAQSTAAMTQ